MNVLEALTGVIFMLHATTLKGVTPALATLDTRAMGFLAQVSVSNWHSDVARITAVAQLVATCFPAIIDSFSKLIIVTNAIKHKNMDTLKSI